ncbi:MAG TPA: GT-D fold domain-containing glycosyltransferase [Dongiaceae bacterium]|nr:GT-D fold domain-containing glycosyltransferase [Dongiaceae bacterium]
MPYPDVIGEFETIEACKSRSIARYGDGEFNLAIGRKCVSQEADDRLAAELRAILAQPTSCMVGIPNIAQSPRAISWQKYADGPAGRLLGKGPFYSSFITRPDNAPHIDTLAYWDAIWSLWRGKDVTLVLGDRRSLRPEMLEETGKLTVIEDLRPVTEGGWTKHAYRHVDEIEERIGTPAGTVIMCLGATATVLAERLARKGVHALDLGHVGMFARHAGIYRYSQDDLCSPAYRQTLALVRKNVKGWGGDGGKHADEARRLADEFEAATILDYGCGTGKLAEAMAPRRVMQYDAGIEGKNGMPKPVDLVVCTDVLEHVEPEKLDAVLDHLFRLAGKALYVVISTRPARTILPDGRNAHLLVKPADWWHAKFQEQGWKGAYRREGDDKEARFWFRK